MPPKPHPTQRLRPGAQTTLKFSDADIANMLTIIQAQPWLRTTTSAVSYALAKCAQMEYPNDPPSSEQQADSINQQQEQK